jgi:hypothetical protein
MRWLASIAGPIKKSAEAGVLKLPLSSGSPLSESCRYSSLSLSAGRRLRPNWQT